MSILNNLLSFLFAMLAGMILIFVSMVIFSILLFSIRFTLTLGGAKVVTKFSKTGMVTAFYFYNPSTKSNATQVDIKFDKADLLAKLAKEISPDYSVYLKISQKKQTLTGISLKVDPKDNAWHANAKVQIRDDGLEDISLNEQSYVLTCKQLNGSCILITYNNQSGLSIQYLQLSNAVRILTQTLSGTSKKAVDVGSTDTSENSKTKEKAEAYPSQKQ